MRKSFYKSILNSAWLWSRRWLPINKKQKYFSLPNHQLAENLILAEKKQGLSEFLTKFVEIRFMIIFIYKSLSNSM